MKTFFTSFIYAWEGIKEGFLNGRNMKFHGAAAIAVILAGSFTGLSAAEWMIITILIGGMITLELLNTAVEHVVDLVTKEFHPLAKKAKDTAAGAVLIFAIASAIIGCLIFLPKWL